MKRSPFAPDVAALPRTPAHGFFFGEDDVTEVHENGERADASPREDALIGTAGSHAPSPDLRAEEPSAEIAARARGEGRP